MDERAVEPRAEGLARTISILGIALGLALRLALPFLLPLGDQVRHRLQGLNDEPAHLRYVEFVATRHALPVQTHWFEEPGAFARADFEFHQPPLYYLISAPLYALAGPSRALLACRLFSALCGIGTLALIGGVLRSSPLPRTVRWPALMFAALWLTPAYFCAVVSNDALSWLIATWMLAVLWARPPDQPSAGRTVWLALALGLGLLTKTTLAVFAPVFLAIFGWESWRQRRARPLLECAVILLVAGLIAAPWYVRNMAVYGSWLGWEWGSLAAPYAGAMPSWLAVINNTNKYFWFPMQHVPVSEASRSLRALGLMLLAAHALAACLYLWRTQGGDARELRLGLVLAGMALAYAARNFLWFAPEARFLLPAFLPIVYGLAAGAWMFSRAARQPLLPCFDLLALALLPFAYLALV